MKKPLRAIAKYDGPQHEPKYWAAVDADERVVVDTLNGDNRWDANEQEVIVKMIVRCVNAHEALVGACRMVSAHPDFKCLGCEAAIKEALAIAKEPT